MQRKTPLESAAQQVAQAASKPPLIFCLPPEQGREALNEAQNIDVYKYPAEIRTVKVTVRENDCIGLYCVIPQSRTPKPGVIYYLHGGGWVFGNFHTHEKLVRELAARTGSVLFFPEFSLSPETKYPAAVEQCFEILNALPKIAAHMKLELNFDSLTVAGDSAGGNIAAVMTLLSKTANEAFSKGEKVDKPIMIHRQLLFYPVTNAYFDTPSYRRFAEGYYLYRDGMKWFWDCYAPCLSDRENITASPLKADLSQLAGLPAALIITGEADVLRDEGEMYARKLLSAGVDVTSIRINGIIHDFVMLNALDQTNACRMAMDAAVSWLKRKAL